MERELTLDRVSCLRMEPAEIAEGWNLVFHILKSSELYSDMETLGLMMQCIKGDGNPQMWFIRGEQEESLVPVGVIITKLFEDKALDQKWLTITHINAITPISNEQWQGIYATLVKFGKRKGCGIFEVFTENVRAQEILENLGFKRTGAFRKEI